MSDDHDRVQRMVRLAAPAEEVWAEIGGFLSIAGWHPLIVKAEPAEIEGETYRHLTMEDGEIFFERLTGTGPHRLVYEVVEGPLPATDYRATLSCVAEGEGGCHVHWSACFSPVEGAERIADEIVGKFYEIGLEALSERFG
ncbi:MAG: SRPBCC family protein [Pikeienuella sp.]